MIIPATRHPTRTRGTPSNRQLTLIASYDGIITLEHGQLEWRQLLLDYCFKYLADWPILTRLAYDWLKIILALLPIRGSTTRDETPSYTTTLTCRACIREWKCRILPVHATSLCCLVAPLFRGFRVSPKATASDWKVLSTLDAHNTGSSAEIISDSTSTFEVSALLALVVVRDEGRREEPDPDPAAEAAALAAVFASVFSCFLRFPLTLEGVVREVLGLTLSAETACAVDATKGVPSEKAPPLFVAGAAFGSCKEGTRNNHQDSIPLQSTRQNALNEWGELRCI